MLATVGLEEVLSASRAAVIALYSDTFIDRSMKFIGSIGEPLKRTSE